MATTGVAITTVTADAGYAYAKVYGALERRGIDALIPTKAEPIRSAVPLRRFRYDARNDIVKCPRGKILRPGRRVEHGRFFYSRARDCARCPLACLCLSKGRVNKAVVISDDYPALSAPGAARALVGRGQAPLPTPPLALGRLPRRGEDLARSRPRRPARPREHAHPGLPDGRRDQPEAARRRSSRAALGVATWLSNSALRRVSASRPSLTRGAKRRRPPSRPTSPPPTSEPGFFNSPRVHWMRNALAHVPKGRRTMVAAALRQAFLPARRGDRSSDLAPGRRPAPAALAQNRRPDGRERARGLGLHGLPSPAPDEAAQHESARAAEQGGQAPGPTWSGSSRTSPPSCVSSAPS